MRKRGDAPACEHRRAYAGIDRGLFYSPVVITARKRALPLSINS